MATTITNPQLAASIVATLTGGAAPATLTSSVNHIPTATPTVGATLGSVNKVYSLAFTVAASGTPTSIDLTAAVDPFGVSNNFSIVHAILLENLSTTAGENMTIGGGTNGLVAAVPLIAYGGTEPGWIMYNAGSTGVTVDGTHKIVTVTIAAGTTVGAKITIIGR